MIGISLDTAPTHTGAVVWNDEVPVSYEQFKEANWLDMAMRLEKWLFWFRADRLDWVALEGVYFKQNAKVHADLNKLLGAIEFLCECWEGVVCFEGKTTEIDSACGIPHKDRKTYTRTLAETFFLPGTKLTEDECDAIAIGIWGYGKYKEYLWGLK